MAWRRTGDKSLSEPMMAQSTDADNGPFPNIPAFGNMTLVPKPPATVCRNRGVSGIFRAVVASKIIISLVLMPQPVLNLVIKMGSN